MLSKPRLLIIRVRLQQTVQQRRDPTTVEQISLTVRGQTTRAQVQHPIQSDRCNPRRWV